MPSGSVSTTINRPAEVVWAAISDIAQIGRWSPECVAGRWIDGADGPVVGAQFEGDNVAKLAGRTVKRWTTTSAVTASEPGVIFEFVVEQHSTWRYELAPVAGGTRVTESFDYESAGLQKFMYDTVLRRSRMITKGMQETLARIKSALESDA